MEAGYAKDKKTIYFRQKPLAGADPATFRVCPENDNFSHDVVFARDATTVYMDNMVVQTAHSATFEVLGANYSRDRQHVFYRTTIVPGADPASFKVYPHDFENADAIDSRHKYQEGRQVPRDDE
jgi:hypothetical protein